MEKNELIKLLDSIFVPLGFKKKGNNWVLNGEEINKIINLQKSQFGNLYYLNYDYVINSLPLNNRKVHVDNQLSSSDSEEQKLIVNLLNLDSDFDQSDRLILLYKLINEKIVIEMQSIHTEYDIANLLKMRKQLYTISPHVLKHFNITFEW